MSVDPRRLGPPPQAPEHVTDRHGYVWLVTRDGGMVTRADDTGQITMGVAAAEREVGPLRPLPSWQPARWWRAIADDGSEVWVESSDAEEVREHAGRAPYAVTVQRSERREEFRWVDA